VGAAGPCGPDSEIFFDTGLPDHPGCGPGCPCGKWLEIWNNVFMEYEKLPGGGYAKLKQANVDTGMGVERTVTVLQGLDDPFLTDTIYPLVQAVERLSGKAYADQPAPFRVIADHVRAAAFAIADGALPEKNEAGYITRRLVRRAVLTAHELGISANFTAQLSDVVFDIFAGVYPGLEARRSAVAAALDGEESKFKETLERGLRYAAKAIEQALAAGSSRLSGVEAFHLFDTYGFPLPLTREVAAERGLGVDEAGFEAAYAEHKEKSRRGTAEHFAGGLAERSLETTRLHTASHLLQAALRQVLGPGVRQAGSNITAERLRFDFTYPARLTDGELSEVERLVNQQIERDLPVSMQTMPLEEALESGALAFFKEKYGGLVKVYTIGDFSREVCGGPHVSHTGELGRFHILKQEAVGTGVRRIRAAVDG
jgi:alanyl-tRNA synthetase